jgi:hypothetical protein
MSGQVGAWAIIDADGNICVRSISDTRRAAIVNWLCTDRGVLATVLADDLMIEKSWQKLKGKSEAELVTVQRDNGAAPYEGQFGRAQWG